MKNIFIAFVLLFSFLSLFAQNKEEKRVAEAVENLRIAMINPDRVMLEKITSPLLSYGHSGGLVENQQQFIEKLLSGKSDFVAIDLGEQSIIISDKLAIVRHKLVAITNDNNKPGEVKIIVMLVWQRTGRNWKLIGRQAVKN
jgi:hypothetical protein